MTPRKGRERIILELPPGPYQVHLKAEPNKLQPGQFTPRSIRLTSVEASGRARSQSIGLDSALYRDFITLLDAADEPALQQLNRTWKRTRHFYGALVIRDEHKGTLLGLAVSPGIDWRPYPVEAKAEEGRTVVSIEFDLPEDDEPNSAFSKA
ncbi:hypothetical protein EON80_24300 [bacterium]|nr:MAG: hypothetical protein EON80_24300 [bacterium]